MLNKWINTLFGIELSIWKKSLIFTKPRPDKSDLPLKHVKNIEIFVAKRIDWQKVAKNQTKGTIHPKVTYKESQKPPSPLLSIQD